MNWEAIGAVGEILGALAVVVTLVYLAVQVRVAKSMAADANRLMRANGAREYAMSLANNDRLRENVAKAHGSGRYYEEYGRNFDLSGEDAAQVDMTHIYWFWLHWGQFASMKSEADLKELAHLISKFYETPAIRYSWDHSPYAKELLDHRFVEFVENALNERRSMVDRDI